MKNYELDPIGVVTLSFHQVFRRLYFWVRLSIWRLVFSLFIITWPAATAGYYHAIGEGLRDPFEVEIDLRESFLRGFFKHLTRSTVLVLLDVAILAIIIFGILFWALREEFALKLLAGIALPFLIYWWLCQPFVFPVLVDLPEASIFQVVHQVVLTVFRHSVYAFLVAYVLSAATLIGLIFIGPLTLITMPIIALIATQSYWALSGIEIPELIDPVEYANRQTKEEQKEEGQTG